MRIGP